MPIEINILGKTFPVYGLLCILGIILCVIIGLILAKKKNIDHFDFALTILITLCGAWIGAKLLFVAVSWDSIIYIFKSNTLLTAINILLKGGYVFYGGLIGGTIALFITLKILKKNVFDYFNIYVTLVPLGHAFGRIGCFASGCCYGMEYDGIFSYTYTKAMDVNTPLGVPVLPIQLIEAFCLILLFIFLIIVFFKYTKTHLTTIIYCISYPTLRFVLECFRGDKERGVFLLSTSQWISLGIIISVIIYLTILKIKKTTKY